MKKVIGRTILAGVVGLTAAGCGSAPVSTDDEANLEESTATLLYSVSFADGGVMKVVEQDDGFLGWLVRAPTGSEASKMLLAADSVPTLARTYAALHGGAEAPQTVQSLSSRLEREQAATGALSARSPANIKSLANIKIEVDKSQTYFNNHVCVRDGSSTDHYEPYNCQWSDSAYRIHTGPVVDSATQDRSYIENDGFIPVRHSLSASGWQPQWPPYSVGWTQWGGVYAGATARLDVLEEAPVPMGITDHFHQVVPR